jgi:NADH:ubiquinone oxidoreductase subunit
MNAVGRWRPPAAAHTNTRKVLGPRLHIFTPLCGASQLAQHRACAWPMQTKYQRRRPAEAFRCLLPASRRHSSSWLKSAGEYLFSDTLDKKVEVGVDNAGNRYFEIVRTFRADNSRQSLRIVEPESGPTAADYDPATVPPQWQSWLSYRRSDPPTPDEVPSPRHTATTEATEGNHPEREESCPKGSTVRL